MLYLSSQSDGYKVQLWSYMQEGKSDKEKSMLGCNNDNSDESSPLLLCVKFYIIC